jgi:hypothetical protein
LLVKRKEKEADMRKFSLVLIATISALGMTGCASRLMKPVDPAAMSTTIAQDEAAIVFFRATSFGGAIQAPVLEVTDNQLRFVAIVSSGAKFLHKTTPGNHLYLIDGEFGYFMESSLEGGKTYYAYVIPKMGWWKARFVFAPVKDSELNSETFKKDLSWCDWYENTPEGQQWFIKERDRLEKRYSDLIRQYSNTESGDKVVMLPEYGTAMPAQ